MAEDLVLDPIQPSIITIVTQSKPRLLPLSKFYTTNTESWFSHDSFQRC